MASLNIGLVAYHAIGNLVFVKVPSERGRYLLTDLCVIAVECPACDAIIGEPCRRGVVGNWFKRHEKEQRPQAHGVGVHVDCKYLAEKRYGRRWKERVIQHHKLHLDAGDIEAALHDAPAIGEPDAPYVCDVQVTRKT